MQLINVNKLTTQRKGLQRFRLHCRDRYHAMTQAYNNCAETHFGGGVEPFCLPVVRHRTSARSNCHRQYSSHKRPRRFCPHRSDRCRALMLTCRNSPLWQRCVMFCLRRGRHGSINSRACLSRDLCVNWNEPEASR